MPQKPDVYKTHENVCMSQKQYDQKNPNPSLETESKAEADIIITRHSIILNIYCNMLRPRVISFSLHSFSFVDLAYCDNICFCQLQHQLLHAVHERVLRYRLAFLQPDQCGLNQIQVNRLRCSMYSDQSSKSPEKSKLAC